MSAFEGRSLGASDLDTLDLDAASDLHRAAFAPLGERAWTRRDIAELLASPGVSGRIVLSGGRAVGMALWRVAADEAELLTIAVDAGHRRQGAGRTLLEAAIDGARRAGAAALFLEVDAANRAACALYAQKEFRPVGRRAGYYQRGAEPMADALVMRLALRPGG